MCPPRELSPSLNANLDCGLNLSAMFAPSALQARTITMLELEETLEVTHPVLLFFLNKLWWQGGLKIKIERSNNSTYY